MKRMKNGFTIVELVIVIAVIGILSAILIPTFANAPEKAKKTAAIENARNTYTQIMADEDTANDFTTGIYFDATNGYYVVIKDGQPGKAFKTEAEAETEAGISVETSTESGFLAKTPAQQG